MIAPVTPLFAVMELESNTFTYNDLPKLAAIWLQDAGGFAALGLLLWAIYALATPSPAIAGGRKKLIGRFMAVVGIAALVAYLVAAGLAFVIRMEEKQAAEAQGITDTSSPQQKSLRQPTRIDAAQDYAMTIGGGLALLAFGEPFFLDLLRLRRRRVYALAKLSFKEAIRRRTVWVFFIILLIFLFPATWFFHRSVKEEDVLKTTISVISYAMTLLLIFTALLLAAFSIPTDVKNQTIHTIITKPVERFEIVVGRFLGYLALETLALIAMTGVSLLFILTSNVNQAARDESMKSRVPVYGVLTLAKEGSQDRKLSYFEGIDVGREYSYRRYIAGGDRSPHRATWNYVQGRDLRHLADIPAVPLEFAFDIYRTTKGRENRGVECSFNLVTWKWDQSQEEEYIKEYRATFGAYPKNIRPDDKSNSSEKAKEDWDKVGALAEKYGRYELVNIPISDYHTYQVMVPPGLIKTALEGAADKSQVLLQVRLKCESPSQFLGVAPLDLYFLETEGHFWINFFKGALGLWCRLAIVIGLAVASSTYLAGVVSFLAAAFLFIGGYFQEFIRSLADNTNVGGGPFEAFTRLVKGSTSSGELDQTPTIQMALFGDNMFRWLIRRVLNVIPDAERFTWSKYLEQGFNIGFDFMFLNLLVLAAYMLPWAVVAYYLMRSREIAA